VISGGDWEHWRPRVAVIESTRPHSPELGDLSWEPFLVGHGYCFAYFDGLNRFYVRREDADLLRHFQTPVCVFDEFVPYHYLYRIERLQRALEGRFSWQTISELARVVSKDLFAKVPSWKTKSRSASRPQKSRVVRA
jgi:hypothetical protein